MRVEPFRAACLAWLCAVLAACGGGRGSALPGAAGVAPLASAGQVAPPAAQAKVSYYAASRFAEQASFGPTPALIASLQAMGFAAWIDAQFALPASTIDPTPVLGFVDPTPDADWRYWLSAFPNLAIASPDQLRLRVSWALSQFIVVSDRKGDLVGALEWANFLQRNALGRYGDLLYHASIHPMMGQFLDNNQNRPKSSDCPHCAPNENFARELMQLFSLGVIRLNADGTPVRNGRGDPVETYSQKDVEELARVLTGWQHDPDPPNRPNRNWANWMKPMVPSTWPPERDAGQKVVLGKTFPAGQSQAKDLRDAVDLLMAHPNIAPFVALRMIQHLVKSNPTPAYVGRVAAVFRDNGSGAAGDMKAVVKAILLDAEARAGDSPATARADDGKLREPFLHRMALWRGLGCQRVPVYSWGGAAVPPGQRPFNAESVFSFYAPTDRAPGSNLLAPEQRLVNASELTSRLGDVGGLRWNDQTRSNDLQRFTDAGCDLQPLITAFSSSSGAFSDQLSQRFFRGAMPPTLRSNLDQLMRKPQWDTRDPSDGATRLIGYALATPYYGVIK